MAFAKAMKYRIYGVLGIKSIMANWNADFSGYPKTTSEGDVFGSDKSFKYPLKVMWNDRGEIVLYIKSYKQDVKKGILTPRTLKERFEFLYKIKDLKKEKDQNEVVKNLFKAIDVKQFGATFAEEDFNIGITGAVQIGQGFNKFEDTYAEEQQILTAFLDPKAAKKNKNGEEAKSTTLGTKVVSNEAHYVYPFAITPSVYREYVELGLTEGYTEEDYEEFKNCSLVSATAFNTNSKLGCENEFAVFVKTDEDCYIPDLAQFVTFKKGYNGELNTITLGFDKLVNDFKDRIKDVEIYYNPYTTIISHNLEKAKAYNIFTKVEIEPKKEVKDSEKEE